MDLPKLGKVDVKSILPEVTDVGDPSSGGQKLVFPCIINGQKYALKFMLAEDLNTPKNDELVSDDIGEVTARASREVEIMRKCTCPYLIKLGPAPLNNVEYNNQRLIFFSEEWVEGNDLKVILKQNGKMEIDDIIRLGKQMAIAINELWSFNKVHRDIKPGNIMLTKGSGDFILLDMGLAFDLDDRSLTIVGGIVGTVPYYSPEQTDPSSKRNLDFRSDLFALGVVMYELLTGIHPFLTKDITNINQLMHAIGRNNPIPPSQIRSIPLELDQIILRLLAKRPHMRYRSCQQLIDHLEGIYIRRG